MADEYTDADRMRDYQELFNRVNAAAGGMIYDPKTGMLDWVRLNTALDKGLEEAVCGLCADEMGKRYIRAFAKLKKHGCIDENLRALGVKALREGLEPELKLLYSETALKAWHNDLLLEPFVDENGDLNLLECVRAGITDIETFRDFGVTQEEIDKCQKLVDEDDI